MTIKASRKTLACFRAVLQRVWLLSQKTWVTSRISRRHMALQNYYTEGVSTVAKDMVDFSDDASPHGVAWSRCVENYSK